MLLEIIYYNTNQKPLIKISLARCNTSAVELINNVADSA